MQHPDLLPLIRARPFQPFVICLADGEAVAVRHPENIALSKASRTATVYNDEDWCFVNLAMITHVAPIPDPRD